MPPYKKAIPIPHGEDFLSLEAITLNLEGGKTVTLRPADELFIPTDPEALRTEGIRAPGRLAFWDYQAERSFRKVRELERALDQLEGQMDLGYRRYLEEEGEKITETRVRSRVACEGPVDDLRKELNAAKEAYGFLRATTDAVRHRMFVLNKLLVQDANAQRG
jgi:hypothetical protein